MTNDNYHTTRIYTVILHRTKDNEIYFWDDDNESVAATLQLFKGLSKKIDRFVILWFNESEVKNFRNNKHQSNHRWKRNVDAIVDAKWFTPEDFVKLIDEKNVMSTLAGLVKNKQWNSIAQALSKDELNIQKEKAKQVKAYYSK